MSNYTCRICSNELNNKTYVAKEMMFGLRHEFIYFQCSQCRCLQIAEIPEDIAQYYSPGNYYSFKGKASDKYSGLSGYIRSKAIKSAVLNNTFPVRIMSLINAPGTVSVLKGIVADTNACILDVGCGNGWNFLYPLYKAGFRNSAGCDPFIEQDIEYTDGPKIHKKEIFDMEGEWDVITFHHSFEHIGNPHETIIKAYELLKPGGTCIIRIPTVSSYAWQHYGVNWFQLDAPRHIFLHSTESIRHLALETGFKLSRIKFDSTHHQFTISERYKSGRAFTERGYKNIFHRISSLIMKSRNKAKAKQMNRLGQGDQAAFYLQKV